MFGHVMIGRLLYVLRCSDVLDGWMDWRICSPGANQLGHARVISHKGHCWGRRRGVLAGFEMADFELHGMK